MDIGQTFSKSPSRNIIIIVIVTVTVKEVVYGALIMARVGKNHD